MAGDSDCELTFQDLHVAATVRPPSTPGPASAESLSDFLAVADLHKCVHHPHPDTHRHTRIQHHDTHIPGSLYFRYRLVCDLVRTASRTTNSRANTHPPPIATHTSSHGHRYFHAISGLGCKKVSNTPAPTHTHNLPTHAFTQSHNTCIHSKNTPPHTRDFYRQVDDLRELEPEDIETVGGYVCVCVC